MRRSIAVTAALSLVVALAGGSAMGTETLASADFEGDSEGAVARPGGPPTVQENVWTHDSGSGGTACVVAASGGKRFRLDDSGGTNLVRGILAPLSSAVSSGVVAVQATLRAEQTGGQAVLCVNDQEETEWYGCIGFGSDGKFTVHGSGTQVSYMANRSYRVTVTLDLGTGPHVDYLVVDLTDDATMLQSTGNSLATGATLGNVTFDTGAASEGAFAFDDLVVTR
jgi:hypothetical protein